MLSKRCNSTPFLCTHILQRIYGRISAGGGAVTSPVFKGRAGKNESPAKGVRMRAFYVFSFLLFLLCPIGLDEDARVARFTGTDYYAHSVKNTSCISQLPLLSILSDNEAYLYSFEWHC